MSIIDVNILREGVLNLRNAHAALQKRAYTEMGAPSGPMLGGGAPMDPNAMPPQGAPMDPNAMPPQGAPMDPNAMPPMDPNAMPPQGAPMDPNAMPPMDPNAMPPMDPNAMPPADPNAMPPQGGISPELQQMLTQLADGMGEVATTSAEQQTAIDQLAKQQLAIEQQLQELRNMLSEPLPTDSAAVDAAPAQQGGSAIAALGQM